MNEYLPWDWDAPGTVLNVDRMAVLASNRGRVNGSIGKTVHKQSRLPDVLSAPIVQDGIQFGPLLDSNAGSYAAGENSDAEIHYIGDSAMVTERALVAANEEPIAQVVRSGWSRFVDWWNDNTVSTPLKVFVLLVAGLVITTNSEWLLPAALGLGFLYLVYYGFRTLVYSSPGEIAKPATMKLNRRQQRRLIHANMRDRLAGQDIVTRSTSLVGSLLTAAIVCISMNLLILAITGSVFRCAVRILGALRIVYGRLYCGQLDTSRPGQALRTIRWRITSAAVYNVGSGLANWWDSICCRKPLEHRL